MSSRNKLLIFGTFLILLVVLTIICFLMPQISIKIIGEPQITLQLGEEYIEQGANAYIKQYNKIKPLNVKINGVVNPNKVGTYILTYSTNGTNSNEEAIRIINVIDRISPEIKFNNEVKMCRRTNVIKIDAIINDNYDGDITNNMKYQIVDDKVIISAVDSSNNKIEITKEIVFIDNEKPKIQLNGNKTVFLDINEKYEDEGAKATDSCDGNLTSKITSRSNVDITKKGIYEIVYSVSDSENNVVNISREVYVGYNEHETEIEYPIINSATIYLTFDDGPHLYTKSILDILDKYNVKATFFVTNQFSKYINLIKDEYESGHAIGIHTYSHKWTIYKSVESYLDDFQKIDNIIFEQTGIHTKLFRFPGGSSNTVSKKYHEGIMTKLSKYMTENGYVYFDWTIDSTDSNKNSTKETIIKNIKENLKGDGEYIILMHDIKKKTVEALPEIIEYAQNQGYEFKVLDENSPQVHLKIVN